MNVDNTDFTAREREIETLKLVVARGDLAIQAQRLTLTRLEEKQIARRAELRLQELLLVRAQRIAARAEVYRTMARMAEQT